MLAQRLAVTVPILSNHCIALRHASRALAPPVAASAVPSRSSTASRRAAACRNADMLSAMMRLSHSPWPARHGGQASDGGGAALGAPGARNAGSLPAAEGHAVDDVMAVDPAMLEGCRGVAGRNRQHGVGKPHLDVRGQVLERL